MHVGNLPVLGEQGLEARGVVAVTHTVQAARLQRLAKPQHNVDPRAKFPAQAAVDVQELGDTGRPAILHTYPLVNPLESAYALRLNKMKPTNPNAHTYVNGTDVKTHGFAVTHNTFLQ